MEWSGPVIDKQPVKSVFQVALGQQFDALPLPIRLFHARFGEANYKGVAQIEGATGIIGRIAARIFGFPSSGKDVLVKVRITADPALEVWERDFGQHRFSSSVSLDRNGYVAERLGPVTAQLGLYVNNDALYFPVLRWKLLRIVPLPKFLMPQSIAYETVDEYGRFTFDILLNFRFGGRIVHYKGWLMPVECDQDSINPSA